MVTKNQKTDFRKNKKVVDINKILVSKEELYGTKNSFKYFIGYNDNDVIRPLCIKLSQRTGYVKTFETIIQQCVLRLAINSC